MEGQSNKLNPEILLRIKEIYNQSLSLESRINEILTDIEPETDTYDILIIEDDNATIMVLTDYFELKGYSSKGVTTGEKAIEELSRNIPKMILLDIVLPDIDGYKISKMIRFDEKFKKLSGVPVYFITAIPETVVSSKISETGARGFLLKPFDFEKFNILFSDL